MSNPDVLISLDHVHARGLLNGSKCVELRRRAPQLAPGTRVWLYSKIPVGEVVGYGTLEGVTVASPVALWERYDRCAGITHEDFARYFDGKCSGAALSFSAITPLEQTVSLDELRGIQPGFQPPQFYLRLTSEALRRRLHSSPRRTEFRPCTHESDKP
jgi:predicted transcriptional regulator